MKSAGKARNNGLYRHIRTSKEIIRNLLNDYANTSCFAVHEHRDVLNSRYRTWCIFNYDGSCVSIELFAKDVTLICLKRF